MNFNRPVSVCVTHYQLRPEPCATCALGSEHEHPPSDGGGRREGVPHGTPLSAERVSVPIRVRSMLDGVFFFFSGKRPQLWDACILCWWFNAVDHLGTHGIAGVSDPHPVTRSCHMILCCPLWNLSLFIVCQIVTL